MQLPKKTKPNTFKGGKTDVLILAIVKIQLLFSIFWKILASYIQNNH